MILQDAIDAVEGNFTCELGAPWRWANLGMTKPYQLMSFDLDVPSLHTDEDIEHRLVARFTTNILNLKTKLGFSPTQKPKLWWRWANKVRIEDSVISARFYIDGNPGYTKGNPSRPSGSPAAGQIRLVKDSERMAA